MNNDLIYRSALIAKYKEMLSIMSEMEGGVVPVDFRLVAKFIDSAPTVDAVEVVRCKDCIHYEFCKNGVAETDFCSSGERREDGD